MLADRQSRGFKYTTGYVTDDVLSSIPLHYSCNLCNHFLDYFFSEPLEVVVLVIMIIIIIIHPSSISTSSVYAAADPSCRRAKAG